EDAEEGARDDRAQHAGANSPRERCEEQRCEVVEEARAEDSAAPPLGIARIQHEGREPDERERAKAPRGLARPAPGTQQRGEGEARDELATVPDGLLAQYQTERERDGEMNARVLPQGLARDRPDACPEEVEQHKHERPPWSDEPTYARPQHQRGKDFDERADD